MLNSLYFLNIMKLAIIKFSLFGVFEINQKFKRLSSSYHDLVFLMAFYVLYLPRICTTLFHF